MSSRAGSGRCQVELAQVDIKSSKPELTSSRRACADVKSNGPGLMSMLSLPGPGQYRVEQAQVDVESIGPEPMLSLSCPGRCQAEQAQANVELSKPGMMSSLPGLGQCRVSWAQPDVSQTAWVDIEWRGPSRCQVDLPLADVEPNGPEPMLSVPSPGRCVVD